MLPACLNNSICLHFFDCFRSHVLFRLMFVAFRLASAPYASRRRTLIVQDRLEVGQCRTMYFHRMPTSCQRIGGQRRTQRLAADVEPTLAVRRSPTYESSSAGCRWPTLARRRPPSVADVQKIFWHDPYALLVIIKKISL